MQQPHTDRHVFISYVHEDAPAVRRLASELRAAGVCVWRDEDDLRPKVGMRWQEEIREAIEKGMFFIACFSRQLDARERSHMRVELAIAAEELLRRPRDRAWFLPVLLDKTTVPALRIGANETLRDLQHLPLYKGWDEGVARLIEIVAPDAGRGLPAERWDDAQVTRRELLEAAIDIVGALAESPVDDVIRSLGQGEPPAARHLYESAASADRWIRLCRDPFYAQAHGLSYWAGAGGAHVASLVREWLGQDDFVYVSIGSGDGTKDVALLNYWLGDGARVTYQPYDASMPLLIEATRSVHARLSSLSRKRLKIKATLADFAVVEQLAGKLARRPLPTVLGLLGQSLGSARYEIELLRAVRAGMGPEDVLLIEVPLDEHAADRLGSALPLRFYFNVLEELGVPYEEDRFRITTRRDLSTIPDTTTQVIAYDHAVVGGTAFSHVPLAYVHAYNERGVLRTLDAVGFEVVHSEPSAHGTSLLICALVRSTRAP